MSMKKSTSLLIAFSFFTFMTSLAHAAETIDELAAEAVRANPKLEALSAQIAALEARADGARTWMDPIVAVEYSSFPWDTWSLGDSAMTGIQVKVQQTFPFPGKNDKREAAAAADTEVKRLEREEMALQLAGMVKQQYLDLSLVRQLKSITKDHIQAVADLLGRVRLRYEVGKGNQQDVLRLELLGEGLSDELEDFDRLDAELTAAINGALHREIRTPIETPVELTLTAPEVDLDWLLKQALANRPSLAVFGKKAAALRLDAEQIDWERKPDFSVWLGYRFRVEAGMDDGTDFLSIGASMPIPFDYTGATEARKRAVLEQAGAAEQDRTGAIDEIAAGLERALVGWRRAVSKERTYRERLVPDARHTLDAALLAYETDRTDFLSIYRSELDLIQFERTIHTARAEAAKMKVAVETLIGIGLADAATKEAG